MFFYYYRSSFFIWQYCQNIHFLIKFDKHKEGRVIYLEDNSLGIWFYPTIILTFFLAIFIPVVSCNFFIALLLTILCWVLTFKILTGTLQLILSTALFFQSIYLFFFIKEVFTNKDYTYKYRAFTENNTKLEILNLAYSDMRINCLNTFDRWLRNIGISNEVDIEIIKDILVKNKQYAGYTDFATYSIFNYKKPTKKSFLFPNWKYRSFWYAVGYSPVQTLEKIPKNSLILMTFVPEDYRNKAQQHQYCLIALNDIDTIECAVLVSSINLQPQDLKDVIAVSLGPIEYALD